MFAQRGRKHWCYVLMNNGKSTKTYQLGDKLESIVDLTNIYRLERFFNLFTYSKQVKLCPNIVLLCYILSQYTYNVYNCDV